MQDHQYDTRVFINTSEDPHVTTKQPQWAEHSLSGAQTDVCSGEPALLDAVIAASVMAIVPR